MSFAQKYDELKILYADENYEKLVARAEKYTASDKTKKEVPPYIWLAKGLYKISESGTTDEKFKNAYKDAIKYLSKGMKYDLKYNEGATLAEHQEFIDMFKMTLVERITNELEGENYKKAYAWAIKYQKITQHLAGVKYLQGACKMRDSDRSSARTLWGDADKFLAEVTGVDGWSEADKAMLKMGALQTAAVYKSSRQMDKAKAVLNKVAQWFENDEDWKTKYDEFVNS
jgi:hypothetical protein